MLISGVSSLNVNSNSKKKILSSADNNIKNEKNNTDQSSFGANLFNTGHYSEWFTGKTELWMSKSSNFRKKEIDELVRGFIDRFCLFSTEAKVKAEHDFMEQEFQILSADMKSMRTHKIRIAKALGISPDTKIIKEQNALYEQAHKEGVRLGYDDSDKTYLDAIVDSDPPVYVYTSDRDRSRKNSTAFKRWIGNVKHAVLSSGTDFRD